MNSSLKAFAPVQIREPKHAILSIRPYLEIVFGLAAIVAAVYFLHLEESLKLIRVLSVAAGGFLLYAILPLKFRLPFLFGLTIAAMLALLGVKEGLILTGFSLALFGIINLPISVRLRTVSLIIAGIALALIRMEYWSFSWGSTVTTILGGLFMFRSILYLYEARFAKKTANLWLRLNYFFLLPNLVFTIFPVVDYKTFINNYYSKPAYETYRKGILWMANGVVHLFAYRLIYYYLIPNPTEIESVFNWLQYVVFSYALIVRLAGIFHLSAGVLCLFGFDLPPTFQHYFFANSFTDLWRRLNIYWRDFVVKVFYYPVYFKIKRIGTIKAVAISILITFAINWLLHFYQWFWLRGTFLFSVQDVSFWTIFGIAVMINSVYEARPKKKKPVHIGFHLPSAFRLSLQVIGTFLFMVLIWSWWTTPSVNAWWGLLSVWKEIGMNEIIILFSGLIGLVFLGVCLSWLIYKNEKGDGLMRLSNGSVYILSVSMVWLLGLAAIPVVNTQIGSRLNIDMEPVIKTKLNAADRQNQFRGYYEDILSVRSMMDTPLEDVLRDQPKEKVTLFKLGALDMHDGLITKTLKPNLDLQYRGARFQTNDLGLRDRPTTQERPSNTLRMVLLGGSIEMGSGVTMDETYENVVEDKLQSETSLNSFRKIEILNFGIPKLHLPQHIARVDQIIPELDPQVVIYTCHSHEIERAMASLFRAYKAGKKIEYEYITDLFEELDLSKSVDETAFNRAMLPEMPNLIEWGLTHIKQQVESMGAIPVWMFVPSLDGKVDHEEDKELIQMAERLGFYILDLRGFSGSRSQEELIIGLWNRHPNALGHKLLAKKMYAEMIANQPLLDHISSVAENR